MAKETSDLPIQLTASVQPPGKSTVALATVRHIYILDWLFNASQKKKLCAVPSIVPMCYTET